MGKKTSSSGSPSGSSAGGSARAAPKRDPVMLGLLAACAALLLWGLWSQWKLKSVVAGEVDKYVEGQKVAMAKRVYEQQPRMQDRPSAVITLTSDKEAEDVLAAKKPAVLLLYNPYCDACATSMPAYHDAADAMAGVLPLYRLDVTHAHAVGRKHAPKIPTYLTIGQDGQVTTHVGARSKEAVVAMAMPLVQQPVKKYLAANQADPATPSTEGAESAPATPTDDAEAAAGETESAPATPQ